MEGPGIADYLIYLLDGQGQLLATTRTQTDDPVTPEDETGWYHFPDLSPGTYVVAEQNVVGWWQSHPQDTGIRLTDPPVNPGLYVVTLSQSHRMEVLDFGNYRSGDAGHASLSGHVYVDVNNNGIRDPQEIGLPNVPITIEGPVTRVVTTDADGSYRADNLPSGAYTISETQPLVFHDGRDTVGTPPLGTQQDDRFVDVELQPAMVAENYNFGEYGLRTQFIGKQLLLASTPLASVYLANLQVARGESLVLLESPAAGNLRASAISEGEPPAIQLYDYQWRPVSLLSRAGTVRGEVSRGESYLIYVDAAGAATVNAALEWATPFDPAYVYTNAQRPHDVNADDSVTPLDALLVINALNRGGVLTIHGVNLSPYYLDVNHDLYLSPLDALLVINFLNSGCGEGEGESSDLVRERALREYVEEAEGSSLQSLEEVGDELLTLPMLR